MSTAPPPREANDPAIALELPEGARVELDPGRGRLRVRGADGRVAVFAEHPAALAAGSARELRGAAKEDALLLAERRGDALYHLRVDPPCSTRICLGERLPGSEQLAVHPVAAGFLVVSERGIALVDARGRIRWRVDELALDWRFEGESDGVLWCSDLHGNVLGFDAASGRPA